MTLGKIPHVAPCINSSINSSISKTPHNVIYDFDKCLPDDLLLKPAALVKLIDDYAKFNIILFI